MSILVFQHSEDASPGRLGEALNDYGHDLDIRHLWRGDDVPHDLAGFEGLVTLGGYMNVDQKSDHPWIGPEQALIRAAHEMEMPVIGICLGCQLMAEAMGGTVGKIEGGGYEVGFIETKASFAGTVDTLYAGLPWNMMQCHWHGQEVQSLPPGAAPLCSTPKTKIQAWRAGLRTYAFQFHFEVTDVMLEGWADKHADTIRESGLSRREFDLQVEERYPEFDRLSRRLCTNIADYLLPAVQRSR